MLATPTSFVFAPSICHEKACPGVLDGELRDADGWGGCPSVYPRHPASDHHGGEGECSRAEGTLGIHGWLIGWSSG
jgi:hypothetical protein